MTPAQEDPALSSSPATPSPWTHYPTSPFGDNIDICPHGCTRDHGVTAPVCIECDYPPGAAIDCRRCANCGAGTWHLDGKCIPCGTANEEMFL